MCCGEEAKVSYRMHGTTMSKMDCRKMEQGNKIHVIFDEMHFIIIDCSHFSQVMACERNSQSSNEDTRKVQSLL